MKKRQGFTLVELMIAMAIIAILATAGVSAYTGYMKKGRDTARAQIAHKLNSSVMAYAASNGGKPPGDMAAFDNFLKDAGDTFGGGISGSGGTGGSSTAFIKDPVGGKDVCLDANKEANQPCRFDYTAYNDGTYAISYGVEDKSSMEKNFYKTTRSVADPDDTDNPPTQTTTKYGVYVGSAPYIGSTPTQSNTLPNSTTPAPGADVSYTPIGASTPIAMTATHSFLLQRIDIPTTTSSGDVTPPAVTIPCSPVCANGNTCNTTTGTCMCGSNAACTGNETCTGGTACITTIDPCDASQNPVAGTVCTGGTVWVTATMRTTPSDAGRFQWSTQTIVTGATSTSDGAANTATLAGLVGVYPAADYCADLSFGGHDDWYLPSKDELNDLYSNKNSIGHFDTTDGGLGGSYYWSSSETTFNNVWFQYFHHGGYNISHKGVTNSVRCVRRVN